MLLALIRSSLRPICTTKLSTASDAGPEVLQDCGAGRTSWLPPSGNPQRASGGHASGDQPGGKFGQQTCVGGKAKILPRKPRAHQPFVEFGRALQPEHV